ncbi:MAG TPA: methyltransferase domain-containing protein [Blastocatellia bacterium]|nr:methyltransferase domain-containing protein [Blastocatellia bacterium]
MTQTYNEQFYQDLRGRARSSAREVVPLVIELIRPRSVIDVGCGVGTWLSVFGELGVEDVMGVDGEYVNREMLEIPGERFVPFDLSRPLGLERRFDLVMSLEVAEHLPPESAESFVASLTAHGPVVLFSAAIPFQGGTHHVNEQWPEYWARLFAAAGYEVIDCFRKRIWDNERVEWFYAQNLLLFVERGHLEKSPALKNEREQTRVAQLALVHPRKYLDVIEWTSRLHETIQELGAVIPLEDAFILVDEDQFGGLLRATRRAIPFPEQDGYYAGPPADGGAALGEFERLRAAGAKFIAFAWPAFWWLDYYAELGRHLRTKFPPVLENDRIVVFDLR